MRNTGKPFCKDHPYRQRRLKQQVSTQYGWCGDRFDLSGEHELQTSSVKNLVQPTSACLNVVFIERVHLYLYTVTWSCYQFLADHI